MRYVEPREWPVDKVSMNWLTQYHYDKLMGKEAREAGFKMKGWLIFGQAEHRLVFCQTSAALWNQPLLRIDFNPLLTETDLIRDLKVVEATMPCILYVDMSREFPQLGREAYRSFGNFLSWYSEKPTDAFVIFGADEPTLLPPEMLKFGRFDNRLEINQHSVSFADLPKKED